MGLKRDSKVCVMNVIDTMAYVHFNIILISKSLMLRAKLAYSSPLIYEFLSSYFLNMEPTNLYGKCTYF